MLKDDLNEVILTALEALDIFVMLPRVGRPDGSVTVNIASKDSDHELMWKFAEARRIIMETPEIAILLELRMLQMQQSAAKKRLKELRG